MPLSLQYFGKEVSGWKEGGRPSQVELNRLKLRCAEQLLHHQAAICEEFLRGDGPKAAQRGMPNAVQILSRASATLSKDHALLDRLRSRG